MEASSLYKGGTESKCSPQGREADSYPDSDAHPPTACLRFKILDVFRPRTAAVPPYCRRGCPRFCRVYSDRDALARLLPMDRFALRLRLRRKACVRSRLVASGEVPTNLRSGQRSRPYIPHRTDEEFPASALRSGALLLTLRAGSTPWMSPFGRCASWRRSRLAMAITERAQSDCSQNDLVK
jgi:hypothetical protein